MTAPINQLLADTAALAPSKNVANPQDPALRKVAQQFESLFTQMLLKSMRASNETLGDSLFGSDSQDFYQDMFDDQMATQLSQGKGLGLADMLVQQLSRGQLAPPANTESPTLRFTPRPASGAAGAIQAAPANLTSKQDFIQQMLPHAQAVGRELGVDSHVLLAQAALETGWGKSMPVAADGASSFNMFGIKAGNSWSGATVSVPTLEFEEGIAVRKVEKFRAYDSAAASFRDYADLIGNQRRYENALGTGSDAAAFASALQQGGYATDPAYARKITQVAAEVRGIGGAARLQGRAQLAAK